MSGVSVKHSTFSSKQGPDANDVFQGEHQHCKKWKRKMSYLSFPASRHFTDFFWLRYRQKVIDSLGMQQVAAKTKLEHLKEY